jgi:hypothetical protein
MLAWTRAAGFAPLTERELPRRVPRLSRWPVLVAVLSHCLTVSLTTLVYLQWQADERRILEVRAERMEDEETPDDAGREDSRWVARRRYDRTSCCPRG